MAAAAKPIPEGFRTVTAQLTLDDAAAAIEWYKRAFGAREVSRSLGPDGQIMHADITIGDTHVMLNDAMMGMKGPKGYGGSPATLWLYVEDSEALYRRAIDAGATQQVPMGDQFWGDRAGALVDPAGLSWWIATRKEDLKPEEIRARAEEVFKKMAASAAP